MIEIKFSWKTLQDEYSDDSPGLLRTPRIAEGILPSCNRGNRVLPHSIADSLPIATPPLIRPESPPHADVSSAIHMTLGNTRTAAIRYGNRDSTLATLGLGIRLAASFLGIMVSESTRIFNNHEGLKLSILAPRQRYRKERRQ